MNILSVIYTPSDLKGKILSRDKTSNEYYLQFLMIEEVFPLQYLIHDLQPNLNFSNSGTLFTKGYDLFSVWYTVYTHNNITYTLNFLTELFILVFSRYT